MYEIKGFCGGCLTMAFTSYYVNEIFRYPRIVRFGDLSRQTSGSFEWTLQVRATVGARERIELH